MYFTKQNFSMEGRVGASKGHTNVNKEFRAAQLQSNPGKKLVA